MESSLESVRLKFTDLITHHLPSLTSLISLPELAQAETEINQLLERLRIQIQEFGLEVLDLETRREREDGGKEVEKLRGDWSRARQATRTSLLNARRRITSDQEREARDEFRLGNGSYGSSANGSGSRKGKAGRGGGDDNLLTASQDVTTALERTVSLLSTELEKSSFSSQLLDESSQSLTSISLEYTSFSSLVKSSTHLIKTMERADLIDKGMVALSFLFFLACVGWILKRRIWDKGISILGFLWGLGGIVVKRGKGKGVEEVLKGGKMLMKSSKELVASQTTKEAVESLTKTLAAVLEESTGTFRSQKGFNIDEEIDEDREQIDLGLGLGLGDGSLTRLNTRPTERVEL